MATKSGSRLQAEILPGNWIVHFSHSGLNSSPKDLPGIFPIYFHSSYKNQTANDGPYHKCFVGYTRTPKVSGSNPADPELNHLWRWAWKALHGFTIFTIHFGVICGYPVGILILKKTWKCVEIYVSLAMTSARCKMSRRLLWGASRLFIIVWYPITPNNLCKTE